MIDNHEKYELINFESGTHRSSRLQMSLWIKHLNYLVPYHERRADNHNRIELGALVTPSDERYIVAFSSRDEFMKGPYLDGKAALISFDILKHEVLNKTNKLAGIAVDPFGKKLFLGQELIEAVDLMAESFGIPNFQYSDAIQLTETKRKMPELIDALGTFFCSREQVFKAYMLMGKEAKDTSSRLLVIVDFNGKENELFPELAEVICKYLKIGEEFELIKATYILLCAAEKKGGPIYYKKF